jgi:inner membrane protein
LTPIMGETVRLSLKPLRDDRFVAWAAVFLCLTTHALLDAVTIYGTRLFWPFWTDPVSLGSIFIIDPLYSLPLLVAMVWALFLRRWTPRYRKALTVCFGLSVAYLSWTVLAQQMISGRADKLLARAGVTPDRLIATPTPFNTALWRVIAIDGDRSFNLYMPVFGGPERATLYAYNRNLRLESCSAADARIAKVARFSHGFYRLMVRDGQVSVADLRMGLTPNYAFRFVLGRLEEGRLVPAPTRRMGGRGNIGEDLDWLFANLRGIPATRLAEAAARVEPARYVALAPSDFRPARSC